MEGCGKLGCRKLKSRKFCKIHYEIMMGAEKVMDLGFTNKQVMEMQKFVKEGTCQLNITFPAGKLGLRIKDLEDGKGVMIIDIDANSRVSYDLSNERLYLLVGDIIKSMNNRPVDNVNSLSLSEGIEEELNLSIIRSTQKEDDKEPAAAMYAESRRIKDAADEDDEDEDKDDGIEFGVELGQFVPAVKAGEGEGGGGGDGATVPDKEMTIMPTTVPQQKFSPPVESQFKEHHSVLTMKTPLSPENEKWINSIINDRKSDAVKVLKEDDETFIQLQNIRRLKEGAWLDDAVIDFYVRVCLRNRDNELCHIKGNKQLHFFPTQFISVMWNDRLKNKADRWKMEYDNVKTWSKKVPGGKLFNLKYVFCPINFENKHWACAVILMEEKHIEYYDSVKHAYTKWRKTKNKPFVPDILACLVEYLKREAEKVDEVILPDKEWTIAIMAESSFQKNGSDCGIFVCVLCDLYSKDCPIKFKQDDLLHCRRKIGFSIMHAKAMLTDHGEDVHANVDGKMPAPVERDADSFAAECCNADDRKGGVGDESKAVAEDANEEDEKAAKLAGFCSTHGPGCAYPGCVNQIVQGGVCVTHGAHRKGCARPGRDKSTKFAGFCSTHSPSCAHPGCINQIVQGGVCVTHGAQRKGCARPGCNKAAKFAGFCSRHGPSRHKCNEDGCDQVTVQGGRCISHGARCKDCGRLQAEDNLAAMATSDQLADAAGGRTPPSRSWGRTRGVGAARRGASGEVGRGGEGRTAKMTLLLPPRMTTTTGCW
jgi:hypothetical protein